MRLPFRPLLILLAAGVLTAQNPYGRITGRVTDPGGALIPGAAVRAVNSQTNVTTASVTNEAGNYEIPNLIPGQYLVIVQHEGFKRLDRGPVEVRVGDVLSLELQLALGALSESVIVTAEAPLLESASSSLGQVVDSRRLEDLPLPGSNPMYLTQLTPGVISTNPPTHGWMPQAVNSVSDAVAGTGTRTSEFTLDGVPNMTSGGQPALTPPPEMVQEVRVQTAPYDASVGHFTGAHINMVFKSGTNSLHGDLVFLHSSRPLATKEYFTNRSLYDLSSGPVNKTKEDRLFPPVLSNRYRAVASGPVYIPGVYNGRNRTFWTYGFSMVDRRFSSPAYFTVPTPAQRQGDLSALLKLGSQYQIYDPATIAPAPNGRFSRQPLPGNIVPASRIDPMAQGLLTYYPDPNVAGTSDGRNNYFDANGYVIDYHANIVRVDQVFGEHDRSYFSYSTSFDNELSAVAFHNEARGNRSLRPYWAFTWDHVHTFRPNLVMDIRYGVNRFTWDASPQFRGFDITKAGYSKALAAQIDPAVAYFPEFVIDAYTALGRNSGTVTPNTYHTLSGVLSHVLGAHTLRYGGEFRTLQENRLDYGSVAPRQEFGATWTRGPLDNSPTAPIGQGLASFLLGRSTGGYIDRNASYADQSRYLAAFLHDDWKLTRRLTLNLGVRYELETPIVERYDRMVRGFDSTTPNPIEAAARTNYAQSPVTGIPADKFRVLGGLQFAGVNGQPRGMWETDKNNFSPRAGFAYLLRPNTVLRGGYGIFFQSLGADRNAVTQAGFSARTSVTPSTDNGLTFRTTMSNPLPEGILEPTGASLGLQTYLGRAPDFTWPKREPGYMQRWSFNLQQEFPHRVLLEFGYMGNRGAGMGVGETINYVPAQYLSTSPVRDQTTIDYLSQAVANPFFGMTQFAGSNLQGRTVARSQLLMPHPQFLGFGTTLSYGRSLYHGLQLRAEKRFSHGYTVQAAYTWSKVIEALGKLNASDTALHRVVSSIDRPQHLTVSGIYEFPFGKGKRFLSRAWGWVNQAAGGWSVQAVYQAQSGPPIGFANIIFTGDLHNVVLPRSQRIVQRWFNTDAGFERDSRKQLQSNIRTFPQRLTGLRADGYNNWDLSVFKSFRIRENVTFQLRAEAQDALNHAMFSPPNTDPTSTLFGQVTSSVWGEQRRIAVGGKLSW